MVKDNSNINIHQCPHKGQLEGNSKAARLKKHDKFTLPFPSSHANDLATLKPTLVKEGKSGSLHGEAIIDRQASICMLELTLKFSSYENPIKKFTTGPPSTSIKSKANNTKEIV